QHHVEGTRRVTCNEPYRAPHLGLRATQHLADFRKNVIALGFVDEVTERPAHGIGSAATEHACPRGIDECNPERCVGPDHDVPERLRGRAEARLALFQRRTALALAVAQLLAPLPLVYSKIVH